MVPAGAAAAKRAGGRHQTEFTGPLDCSEYSRRTLAFASCGDELDAWLYLPKGRPQQQRGGKKPPLVIMGHGLGAQKDMGLHPYASAFAAGGLAVLVFDYRGWGGSTGTPRQWASPTRHLQDWAAALAFASSSLGAQVDTGSICLWGSSFAGGHVLVTAAQAPANIVAVIAQVPHLDARAAADLAIKKRGVPRTLLMIALGALDTLGGSLGLPPIYLRLVGPPRSFAFMQLNEFERKEYFSKHPPTYQGHWANKVRAALAFELLRFKYSPIQHVPRVACPTLIVGAIRDELCPVDQIYRAGELAPQGQLLMRDCTHFELYRGKLFEELIADQVAFLQRHTGLKP